MVKLIALYRHPEDQESFDKHYEQVHTPLVEKMPGLKKLEVTRIRGAPMGGKPNTIWKRPCILQIVPPSMPP